MLQEIKVYSLADTAEKVGVPESDILDFLKLRNYVMQIEGYWYATILGVEKGCVIGSSVSDVICITEKGFKRIKKAFSVDFTPWQEKESERIYQACKEAEKNMKPFSCGKAE